MHMSNYPESSARRSAAGNVAKSVPRSESERWRRPAGSNIIAEADVTAQLCRALAEALSTARDCSELRHFRMYARGECVATLITKLEGRTDDRDGIPDCSEAFAISCDSRRNAFDDVVRSDADTL